MTSMTTVCMFDVYKAPQYLIMYGLGCHFVNISDLSELKYLFIGHQKNNKCRPEINNTTSLAQVKLEQSIPTSLTNQYLPL